MPLFPPLSLHLSPSICLRVSAGPVLSLPPWAYISTFPGARNTPRSLAAQSKQWRKSVGGWSARGGERGLNVRG